MKKSYTISYEWRNPKGEIDPTHKKNMDRQAEIRINQMTAMGFTSGELLYEDLDYTVSYKGYWEKKVLDN